jgi:hypothetical protein
VLKVIWLEAEQPWGKRLRSALPIWLPFYEKHYGKLSRSLRRNLLGISAATIDQLLTACRARAGSRGRCGMRRGTLLRSQIPIRTEHWHMSVAGFYRSRHGGSLRGIDGGRVLLDHPPPPTCTLNGPRAAVWNRGQLAVLARIAEVEAALPFFILGFDVDNGGEFLNWRLFHYFDRRARPVQFTRPRAYRKDDNARVEQKTWTHVRQLVGYGRLEGKHAAELLSELYAREWSFYRNFFCPVMKHLRTEVEGSRNGLCMATQRRSFDRLKQSPNADPPKIARLKKRFAQLDPVRLERKDLDQAESGAASPSAANPQPRGVDCARARGDGGARLSKRPIRRPAVGLVCSGALPSPTRYQNYFRFGVFFD